MLLGFRRHVLSYKVKKGEEINPYEIHKVPVKPGQFQGSIIFAGKIAIPYSDQHDSHDDHAAQDVYSVQTGHGEINGKEDMGIGSGEAGERVEFAGQLAEVDLVAVFEILDYQKDGGQKEGAYQKDDRLFFSVELNATNGQGNGYRAGDQYYGVNGAEGNVEILVGVVEHFWILRPEHSIGREKSPKKQHLS